MRSGLDYYSLAPAIAHAQGASFVCRYLSGTLAKNLTRHEADELARLGIDCVVMWETTERRAQDGELAGEMDAHAALLQAISAGMVGARPIYFTVDFDTSLDPSVIDWYFHGVNKVLGVARTGAYGGITTIDRLFNQSLISYAWQTSAWSRGQWNDRAQLRQVAYDAAWDRDEALVDDFGQWRPGVGPPHPVPAHPYALLLPAERVAVDRYLAAEKHPHIHANQIKRDLAVLVLLRKQIWVAAVHGKAPDGEATPAGWGIRDRTARYRILWGLTK